MQRASGDTLTKQGVDAGPARVGLHCRVCEGLTRHPDGSLQKRFGKSEVVVAAQLALRSNPSPSPKLAERGPATVDPATVGARRKLHPKLNPILTPA